MERSRSNNGCSGGRSVYSWAEASRQLFEAVDPLNERLLRPGVVTACMLGGEGLDSRREQWLPRRRGHRKCSARTGGVGRNRRRAPVGLKGVVDRCGTCASGTVSCGCLGTDVRKHVQCRHYAGRRSHSPASGGRPVPACYSLCSLYMNGDCLS